MRLGWMSDWGARLELRLCWWKPLPWWPQEAKWSLSFSTLLAKVSGHVFQFAFASRLEWKSSVRRGKMSMHSLHTKQCNYMWALAAFVVTKCSWITWNNSLACQSKMKYWWKHHHYIWIFLFPILAMVLTKMFEKWKKKKSQSRK